MRKKDNEVIKKPSKFWFLFASLLLSLFIIVQLPVSWIIQKYMPNSPYVVWISGNLWQGSASVQLPNATSPNPQTAATAKMNATVSWQWKPLKIFLGKFNADVDIISDKSKLTGELTIGRQSLQFNEVSGRIDPDTINKMVNIQLPNAPIQINKLSIDFDKENGFNDANGQLTWVGGQLGYPNEGRIHKINLPTMRADLAVVEAKNNKEVKDSKMAKNSLHLHLVDDKNKALGDFYLDNAGMLDVNLTQRLLENMPSYTGSAPKDTAVVSVRQPITSLGN